MPKVLISDALADEGLAILQAARGLETVNTPGLKGEQLLAAVADVEGLVVRSGTQVTREVIDPLGHPENPMDERAMTRKFEDCLAAARHPTDAASARRLAERLEEIERVADVREVFA